MDFNEHDCLCVNPFEGDFGDSRDKILPNKIVITTKESECFLCHKKILKGEKTRGLCAIFDGDLMSYRWCSECCHAMSISQKDNGEAWEKRYEIARDN